MREEILPSLQRIFCALWPCHGWVFMNLGFLIDSFSGELAFCSEVCAQNCDVLIWCSACFGVLIGSKDESQQATQPYNYSSQQSFVASHEFRDCRMPRNAWWTELLFSMSCMHCEFILLCSAYHQEVDKIAPEWNRGSPILTTWNGRNIAWFKIAVHSSDDWCVHLVMVFSAGRMPERWTWFSSPNQVLQFLLQWGLFQKDGSKELYDDPSIIL